MKRFLQTILLILFLFQGQAFATHSMGGEVTYRYLGGLKYEITFKFYRDCRGISIDSISAQMRGNVGTASKSKRLTPTRISIKDVSNYCKKNSNPCGKANTIGSNLGIEEHLFRDTIDFDNADSAFKKCCVVQLGFGQCCRITSEVFWVYGELNICTAPKNSSPVLTSVPSNILCCNQPFYYNNGAVDSIDLDSLSYSWADPFTSWTAKTTWGSGKSSKSPFADYFPSGYDKNKGPKPDADPPIGTYLDPETGDLILTPTDCSDVTNASIKISEWRKDSTGTYKKIGEVSRDMVFFVVSCSANNPPILNGPYRYEVCANQKICFTVVTSDKQVIPPPPAKPYPPDTVLISWNRGINKGATFKILDSTARLQKGQFCWTPKESDASDLPYTFTVTARDNNCPMNGISIKSYSVRVKKNAKTSVIKKHIKNGLYEIKSEKEAGFKGTATYKWYINDSVNRYLDTAYYFYSVNPLQSSRQVDSVQFYKGGKYIIVHTINNPPLNCPTTYFDTIKVGPVTPILKMNPSGFQQKWACKNAIDTIFPSVKNAKKPVKYKWSSSSADTLPYIIVKYKRDTTFRVDVYDSAGYHQFAEWKIFLYPEPKLVEKKDISICNGDTVSLSGSASNYIDTVYWKWFFNGKLISTNQKISLWQTGIYSLKISDTTKCFSKSDSIKVSNMVVTIGKGMEKTACLGDTVSLSDTASKISGPKFWKWFFAGKQISTDSNIKIVELGKYSLEISDSNKCLTWRDTIERKNMILNADAGSDIKVCQYETVVFNANGLDTTNGNTGGYLWYREDFTPPAFSNKNTFQFPFNKDGRMILQLQQMKGTLICADLDTVYYSFRQLPEVILRNGTICQNETELDLQNIILKPTNSAKGVLTWQLIKTLKKPGGSANSLTDLVYDKDPTTNNSYYLKVDKSTIDLNGKFKDSVILGLTYKDEFGCQNASSNNSNVIIRSNIEVTLIYDELKRCHGDSVTYISNDYGVNYYGGLWFTLTDSSNYLKWPQGHLIQIYEKLGTASLDPKGGKYRMRYLLENNQCFSSKDALLKIVPYPTIAWTQTDKGDSIILKDNSANAERREWFVNSKKKSELASIIISKQNAKTFTILLKVFNTTCETDSIIKPIIQIGINNLNPSKFSISPNPVKKDLLIKTSIDYPYCIEIINNLGQTIFIKNKANKVETINVSGLPDGIYNLLIKTPYAILMQKFIKTAD